MHIESRREGPRARRLLVSWLSYIAAQETLTGLLHFRTCVRTCQHTVYSALNECPLVCGAPCTPS